MIREDCYWHSEEPDMGARLHLCSMKKGIEPLETCDGCKKYHSRYKRTNGDLIRAMTDEELAMLLGAPTIVLPPWCNMYYDCPYIDQDPARCDLCALDWLKQEAT